MDIPEINENQSWKNITRNLSNDENLRNALAPKEEIIDSIKFITGDSTIDLQYKERFLSKLKNFSCDISCLYNANFIFAEWSFNGSAYSNFKWLEYAKNLCMNNPGQTTVIFSIIPKDILLQMKWLSKYTRLFNKNNVFFVDLLHIESLGQEIANYNNKIFKEEDINNESSFREMITSEISKFLHDSLHDDNLNKAIMGLNNKEILKYLFLHEWELDQNLKDFISNILKLLEYQHPGYKRYSREEQKQWILDIYDYEMSKELPEWTHYEWVFIDRDGCLFDNYTGKFNDEVLEKIKHYEEEGVPVHIWTWWNIEAKQKILDNANLWYKMESKTDYKGASVDIIIDNNNWDIIFANTKIKANQYIIIKAVD